MEVAHDIQKSVSKYVRRSLKFTNSYDTWHGNGKSMVTVLSSYSVCSFRDQIHRKGSQDHLQGGQEMDWSEVVSAACGQT